MSDSNNSGKSGGIGFIGLLTLLFVGLKLGGVITWSWFWVLSPMLLTLLVISFFMALFVLIMLVGILMGRAEDRFHKWRW